MRMFIKQDQLELAAEATGRKLLSISGYYLSDSLEAEEVVVEFDGLALLIRGEVEFQSLEGVTDEFSRIVISRATVEQVRHAQESGNIYFQSSGQKLEFLMIGRDTITKFAGEIPEWTFETDSALVFCLESSQVVISKVTQHAELLKVSYLGKTGFSSEQETSGRFQSDLFNTYTSRREYLFPFRA